ncbi:MAG: helix-turn-helix transcriptional regulator [Lachnospiraceae bacterium]|nr:helix-turn-helix transcriptional regulator [Lachnospiraceae bacterium]
MTIGERVFAIMERNNLSQYEFSRLTGIAQSTISDWKRKKTNPASDKLMVICDVLYVSLYELLSGTEESKYKQLDYIVIDKKTEEYSLIEDYQTLDEKNKARLKGYLEALVKK